MPAVSTSVRSHALVALLDRYVTGQISGTALDSVCALFDDASATPSERLAFARFYLDTLGEAAALPRPEEWTELLSIARA